MKRKVLHLIDNFARGGAPLVVKNIVDRIGKDFESYVCPLRPIVELTVDASVIRLSYRNYDPRKVLAIVRFCRQNEIDIIHGHLSKGNICCMLVSFLVKAQCFLHEHGEIFCGGRYVIYRWLLRLLSGRISKIVAVSEATKKQLAETCGLSKDKIAVIPNFVDFEVFDCSKYHRESVRSQLNFHSEHLVVGFVGRLDYSKGCDVFVETASILLRQNRAYRFLVVGDGPQRDLLEGQARNLGISDYIVFVGMVENPAPLMRAMDIAMVPSRREAFGMTTVEFMAMSVPVVVSNIGGLKELVIDGQTGLRAESSGEDFAQAVCRLVMDFALRNEVAAEALRSVQKYSVGAFMNNIESLYQNVQK